MYVACIVECLNELCAGKLWPVMCVSSLSYDVTDIRVHANARGGWDKVCAHVVQLKFHRDSAQ